LSRGGAPCNVADVAHVLVVDDDADSREGLARLLVKRGHQAEAVPNGREALSVLTRKTPPDIVVLDLRMPEMDGVMFLEVLRSYLRLQNTPVVLLTAYPESPDVERVKRLGVLEVFRKADDFNVVLDAVDRHVNATSS
jgi:CheY-like chemotaxis protein